MSNPNTSEKSVDLDRQENQTKGNVSAKKVSLYTYDSSNDVLTPFTRPLVANQDYDYQALTEDTLTDTWVYKLGGAGGTTILTVVITYTDSGKGTIATVGYS